MAPSEAERGKGLCVGGARGRSSNRGGKSERGGGDVYVGQAGARVAIVNRRAGWMWKGPHAWDARAGAWGATRFGRRARGGNIFGGIGGIFFSFRGEGFGTWVEEQRKAMCVSSMMRLPASLSSSSRRRDAIAVAARFWDPSVMWRGGCQATRRASRALQRRKGVGGQQASPRRSAPPPRSTGDLQQKKQTTRNK